MEKLTPGPKTLIVTMIVFVLSHRSSIIQIQKIISCFEKSAWFRFRFHYDSQNWRLGEQYKCQEMFCP